MRAVKSLNFKVRKKLLNNQALNSEELKEIAAHKLHLFGTIIGFNPLDRVSVQHHVDRVKWFYDKEEPNHVKIKETAKLHELDIKFNPIKTYKDLKEADLFNIREIEQHQLFEDYKRAFPESSTLQLGSLRDNLTMLKQLQNG
jgi:hypothetical protein